MASSISTRRVVQTTYTDNWTRGYPGQLVSEQDYQGGYVKTFPTKVAIPMGRGVAIGDNIPHGSNSPYTSNSPFTITNTEGALGASLVGVTVRPYISRTNIDDGSGNNLVAGYEAQTQAAVLLLRTQKEIIVDLKEGTVIAVNDLVYVAVAETNDPDIEIGQFSNDDAGTTGMILFSNAIFYESKTATADDAVVVIKLNV